MSIQQEEQCPAESMDPMFAGHGDIRRRCRAIDWSATSLGPPATWPRSLRLAVRMCLDARFPMCVWAGPELVLIYNDGYPPVLGAEKHPSALGRPAVEVWPRLWEQLGAELESVIEQGVSTHHDDTRFRFVRNGREEDAYFTYSFTPIQEDDGRVVGALNVFLETTSRVRPLLERTALLHAISDSSRDRIFAKDLSGRMLFANPAMLAWVGRPAEEVLGKTDLELLDDQDAARRIMALDRGVMASGTPSQFEERVRMPDGTERVWHSLKTPYRNGGSNIIGLLGISRDITDRKRDDEKLRAALAAAELERGRLSAVFEALPEGIAIADPSGALIQTNAALQRIWGCRHVEQCRDWQGRWVESGEPVRPDEWALARALASGEIVSSGRIAIERRDGSGEATITTVAAPIKDRRGPPLGAVVVMVDVTEQRRAEDAVRASEERFRTVIENSRDGINMLDLKTGRYVFMSPAQLELCGFSADELKDLTADEASERVHPDDRAVAVQHQKEVAAGRDVPEPIEYRWKLKSGEYRWLSDSRKLVRDAQGLPVALVGVSHDITDRKNAEQREREIEARARREREQTEEALREADRRKNEFLAVLSHELRNPLAPIRNSVYILERAAPGGEKARRALQVIERQAQLLTRLIDDLLDVTRISRGKVNLKRERLDLSALARGTAEDFRDVFTANGIDLEIRESPEPLYVSGDATRLAQVIGNLLSNSAKFTARGGTTVLTIETNERDEAVVRVRDDGAGMSPQTLEHLFEPFMQAAQTIERTRGGLGLGLALVKGLVEMHGGTVGASSGGEGRGSELTFTLPLLSPVRRGASAAREADRKAKTRRVLVVEDNIDAAASLKDVLDLGEHEVAIAHSGPEGLALAHSFKPDVVLSDIGLPGMDGYDVAKAMRADPDPEVRATFLVALSGYAQPEDLQRSKEAGFDRHLSKPASLEAIEQVLAEAPRHDNAARN